MVGEEEPRDLMAALEASLPHRYTVDVILHGAEPYPCVICGGWRQDPRHTVLWLQEVQEVIDDK